MCFSVKTGLHQVLEKKERNRRRRRIIYSRVGIPPGIIFYQGLPRLFSFSQRQRPAGNSAGN